MTILHHHRNCIVYKEYCKITKINDTVSFNKALGSKELYFTIPFANTSVLLLGPGSSITNAAMHHLVSEGVMVGFTGGDGVPVFAGSLSEYRPTEYCQKWIIKWNDNNWKLNTAKRFQNLRSEYVQENWSKIFNKALDGDTLVAAEKLSSGLLIASKKDEILGYEANYAKRLYALLSAHHSVNNFRRNPNLKEDTINELIDTHNYYAYGISAVVLWSLGIPFAFPVLHGDTRRGALVFDLADIIKDAYLLPLAFKNKDIEVKSDYKKICADVLNKEKVMVKLFEAVKEVLEC